MPERSKTAKEKQLVGRFHYQLKSYEDRNETQD